MLVRNVFMKSNWYHWPRLKSVVVFRN